MTHDDFERRLVDWLQEGPDRAARERVDVTFAPLSRIPQRDPVQLRLAGAHPRRMVSLLAAAALIVALAALGLAGAGGRWTIAPTSKPGEPSWRMTLAGSYTGVFGSVPDAPVDICRVPAIGPIHVLYIGGSPRTMIDLLVGDGIAAPPGSERVAAEIGVGEGPYVRFDPEQIRTDEAAGRSTASVRVEVDSGIVRITLHAVTPNRDPLITEPAIVDLVVECPS